MWRHTKTWSPKLALGANAGLSVCQAMRRAARGRLQLHTYAHNMQTKNLKGIVLQGSLTGPNRFIGSKPVGAIAFHSGHKITDCEYYL